MRKNIIAVSLLFLFLITINASAEKTVKTIDLPFGFLASSTANVNYTRNITLDSPDGISKIISTEVMIRGDFIASTRVILWVNKKQCSPTQLVTPAVATNNYDLTFDCSSLTKDVTSGNYTLTLNTNRTATNLYANTRFTYYNDPKAVMTIHGTEYTIGQLGKLWVQVLDVTNIPINNATCYAHIYYPDGTTFSEKSLMSFLEDGVYEYDFIIPNFLGVYPSIVECFYVTTSVLNNAISGVADVGTVTSGDYTSTWILDSVYWTVNENSVGGVQHFQTRMNFTNVTQPALQTGLSISWTGIWDASPNTDSANVYIMNFTSGKWFLLPNKILDTTGDKLTYTNTIMTTNATRDGWVKNGIVSILLNDSDVADGAGTNFRSDYVHVDVQAQYSSQYEKIIGSGEIHVNSPLNLIYTIETLCSDITTENYDTMADCGIFTDDEEFNNIEGEVEDNITIFALETKETYWAYTTPYDVDCSAFYWLKEWNGTSWELVDENDFVFSSFPEKKNCQIDVTKNFVKGETYFYKIKYDNYLKYDVEWSKDFIIQINETVTAPCDYLALTENFIYDVPLTNETLLPNQTTASWISIRSCYLIYEDLYWAQYYYSLSNEVDVVGEYYQYYIEMEFYKDSLSKHFQTFSYYSTYYTIPSTPYIIDTLCQNGKNDPDCGIFTDDEEYNLPEGEIDDYINITAIQTRQGTFADAYWVYTTPNAVDCTAFYWLKEWNGTSWELVDDENIMLSSMPEQGNCEISVYKNFTKGEIYQYHIKMDNYLKYDAGWSKEYIDGVNATIYPLCQQLAQMANYTYDVPITNETVLSNNTSIKGCHMIFEDAYWYYLFYDQSLNVTNVGDYYSYYREAKYYDNAFDKQFAVWAYWVLKTKPDNVTINQTAILNLLNEINATTHTINSTVYSINSTVSSLNMAGILAYLSEINATTHEINSSMIIYYGNLYNLIVSVNSSINSNINAMNGSLWNGLFSIQSQLQGINDNLTLIYNLVGATNTTIMNKLFRIQEEITSVNDTIKEMNASIHIRLDTIDITLNSIQSDLTMIKGNLTEIKVMLTEINGTTYLIASKIDNLSLQIGDLNSSLISWFSASLNGLESNLTTLIISVNDTVISSNITIMNKLYGLQDEIASLNQTLINGLLNISNVTVNITTSQQEVINTMVALYGNQAKNRNFAYLGVGITGLLTGGDSGAVQYCKDNMTLAQYSVQNVTGSMNMTNVFEDLTRCTYGCVKDACVIPQYMIWLYVLIALILVFVVYLWFERQSWSEE